MSIRSLLLKLLLPLLLISAVIAAGSGWALMTESGARWLLAQADRRVDGLDIGDISGTITRQLNIGSLRYRDAATDVVLRAVQVELRSARLLAGELHVSRLEIEEIGYRQLPGQATETTEQQPFLLPIDLIIAAAGIKQLRILGETEEQIDDITASVQWRGPQIVIEEMTAAARGFAGSLSGDIRLHSPIELDLSLNWRAQADDALRGTGRISGSLNELEINHELAGRYNVTTTGSVNLEDKPQINLVSTSNHIDQLIADRAVKIANARVQTTGTVDDYRVSWSGNVSATDFPDATVAGSGTGNTDRFLIDSFDVVLPRGKLSGNGELGWAPDTSWQFALRLADLDPSLFAPQWPGQLSGSLQFSGAYEESGLSFDISEIAIAGTVQDRPVALTGSVKQSGEVVQLMNVALASGRSTVAGNGSIFLTPQLGWETDLVLRDVDPAIALPDWPGELNGTLAFNGSLTDAGPKLLFDRVRIGGQLRDQPLQLSGVVRYGNGRSELAGVRVSSGANRLAIDGLYGQRMAINLDADISDLGNLGGEFGGSLNGTGRIGGSATAPVIDLDLTGNGLRVPGYAVATVRAFGRLAPGGSPATLQLEATQLEFGDQRIDSLDATLAGSLDAHELGLDVASPIAKLDAQFVGGWLDGQWRGQLKSSVFDFLRFGVWRQQAAAELIVTREQFGLQRACWFNEPSAACIDGSVDAQQLLLNGELRQVSLEGLAGFVPAGFTISGLLDGSVTAGGSLWEPIIEFSANSPAVDIQYQEAPDTDPIITSIQQLLLTGTADASRLAAKLTLSGDNNAALFFEGQLDQWSEDAPQVQARLDASLPDTALLGLMTTQLTEWKGSLTADLSLAGNLNAPTVAGFARLEDASATVPGAGITLEQLSLNVRPAGTGQVALTGSARSGDGEVSVESILRLSAADGWPISGTVNGNRFTVLRLPGIDLAVSPTIKLDGNIKQLRLSGDVLADRAVVEFKELPPQAVRVSPDVIVVGETGVTPATEGMLQLNADLNLKLGDQVSFSGFGLRTDLAGELALTVAPGKLPQGRGIVSLESGRFQAYGQDLQIENGRLLFNGPLDDPILDVTATRSIEDVTVGLRLSGSGQSPVSTIFSEPAMAEADALAYLVIGRPLSEASAAQGNTVKNSAILLGAKHASAITDQVGRVVGLDELRLDTRNIDAGAIMAGKKVGPDLYLRYSYGLFSRIGALLLRYRLNSRLSLEARSGEDQSVDVIYTREAD